MAHPASDSTFNEVAQQHFQKKGFVVLKKALPTELRQAVVALATKHLAPLMAPVEYEADVGYPGAPSDREADGGQTARRLLHAYARDEVLDRLVRIPPVVQALRTLLGPGVEMSQCHHNCIMTKHPGYSSATLWHQDIRYWSFDKPELISAWYALGEENKHNGALQVIPGSHLLDLDRGRLDGDLFLRPELPENQSLIDAQETVALDPGDVLLFHCRLFHAAGQNLTDQVKLTPVFTFHSADNLPIPQTRSARFGSIKI